MQELQAEIYSDLQGFRVCGLRIWSSLFDKVQTEEVLINRHADGSGDAPLCFSGGYALLPIQCAFLLPSVEDCREDERLNLELVDSTSPTFQGV